MAATGTYSGESGEVTVTVSPTTTVQQGTASSLKTETSIAATASALVTSSGVDNMGADVTSTTLSMSNARTAAIQIEVATASAAGTIYIRGRNSGGAWCNLTWINSSGAYTSSIAVAGANVNEIVDIADTGLYEIGVFYDYTSGNGQLDVRACKK